MIKPLLIVSTLFFMFVASSALHAGDRYDNVVGAKSKALRQFKHSLRERNGLDHNTRGFSFDRDRSHNRRHRYRDRGLGSSQTIQNQNTIIILNNDND